MPKAERRALVTRVRGYVAQLRGSCPLSLGGVSISPTNREIFSRCVEDWLFLIEDLMIREGLSEPSRIARTENFFSALVSADVTDTLSLLEAIYDLLIREEVKDADAFKQRLRLLAPEAYPIGRLLSPINGTLYAALIEPHKEAKAYLLATLGSFLRFPRKLEFQDIGLEDQALEGYLETEQELAAMTYDCCEDALDGVSQVIADWFRDFQVKVLLPSHGPGSVAEGPLTLAEKFAALKIDKIIAILLSSGDLPQSYQEYFPGPVAWGLDRCSRTIFVPKTATKLRTISMEPVALQYIQQGVMHELYRFIEEHPVMGVHMRLRDQVQNQVEALIGSAFHNYGTIDLSHASDSVSWALVRRVFHGVPRLYKWLLGTRSRETILPDGTRMSLKKFAPMGSALCFPVECIIFGAVVEYASRRAARHSSGAEKPFWTVYGDDIVVPSSIYQDVINILESFGFTVNTSKSYNDGEYRESCGKEYFAGIDITPLYYRTPFYKRRISPGAYGSWCSSANNALVHRLPLYRWHLIQKCLRFSRRYGPYFVENPHMSPYMYSAQPTNFHVRKRWSSRYQRWEGRFTVVRCEPRGEELADDTLMYHCKLVDMAKRSSTRRTMLDEPSPPRAMHGCIEKFSSVPLPIVPFKRIATFDWE